MDTPNPVPGYVAGFDEYVTAEIARFKVPGVGVAIIDGDDVPVCKGYGLREVERALPATGDTLFAIGSCSKAFTTAVLATLADEGKLDWDKPVREYIPWFKMQDPFASERMTARDLCCHRSGLPRHDLVWYGQKVTRKGIVERLQYLEPSKDFRTFWQYQNLMYTTAGYLAEVISGTTWESLVSDRIFKPLGMNTSNFSPAVTQTMPDASRPYTVKDEMVRQVTPYDVGPVGPAGSIYSSAREMANWVKMHLNLGKFGDKQVISEAQVKDLHFPHTPMPSTTEVAAIMPKEFGPMTYGLGWMYQTYRNNPCVWHSGGIDGYISFTGMLPERKGGVVVLTNTGASMWSYFLGFHVFDLLLGLEPIDWSARYGEMEAMMKKMTEEAKAKAMEGRVPDTKPSHALDAYAGRYCHPAYGTMTVEKAGEGLVLKYSDLVEPLVHFHYDEFSVTSDKREIPARIAFHTDPKGGIGSVSAPWEAAVKPIVFVRAQ
jgi:CubicO group peptidase (beta-lactamase class C family)